MNIINATLIAAFITVLLSLIVFKYEDMPRTVSVLVMALLYTFSAMTLGLMFVSLMYISL